MDESLRIPVEIDISKGLAQLGKFGAELQSVAKSSGNAAASALSRLDLVIEQIGERARETKTQLVNLGNARLPLTSINAYNSAIYKIKQNTTGVTFAPIVSGLKDTESAAGKAANALTRVKPGSDQATQSLINLSRVAQDAPYGFLGIANNLNPLLESFQRLKASTGSTGGALKALGSSLTGAGGIGLALGVASSLLVVFGDKLFNTGKKAEEAEDKVKKYKDTVTGIFAEAAKEATQVVSLIAVLKNEAETRERKLAAIKELQRIQPDVFKGLKLEGDAVTGLDGAYQAYLANLRTVIAVKIKQAQLDTLIAKQLQNEGVTLTASEKKWKDLADGLTKAQAATKVGGDRNLFAETLNKKLQETSKEANKTQADIEALIKDITELSKGVKVDIDKDKSTDDQFNKIISKAKEIAAFLKDSFIVTYEFSPLDDKATALKKAQSFLDDVFKGKLKVKALGGITFSEPPAALIEKTYTDPIADGIRKGIIEGVAPTGGQSIASGMTQEISKKFSKLFAELGAKMPDIDFDLAPSTNEKFLQDQLDKAKLEVPVYLNPSIKQGTSFAEAIKQSLIGLNQQFVTLVADLKNNVANAIGDGIGAAATGGGFESLFQGIIGAVGTAMQQLGKAMIAYGIGMEKLKAAIKSLNPGVAIAAGIGLVALGAIVKSKASKSTPFAAGGLVFGPTTGLVGEGTGTNRNNPEVISPLDKLKGFFAGMLNDVTKRTARVSAGFGGGGVSFSAPQYVELFASGNSLKGVLSLTEQMQNRSF